VVDSIKISSESLPKLAKAGFSVQQLSYIDEFSFYRYGDNDIEAWYAGEYTATWSGSSWEFVGVLA
jgi:hypothetical protein